ncbi:MAG: undecaprenyldiphospho-muramoylpentapeptide beta-N-acetylglucosaminyltransferase [Clostridiales bacterium]|nr:undecaprenyldiphospho-muramoylpentapeptide beta-N-acetylglucosaminyltransferase [Clostridiales bacterium]MCF8021361.1 undecaprenyldiphospho-muramoylpentapeptide beta-N-acetylglucosaminyltransferase [Clostridiales bacterium]
MRFVITGGGTGGHIYPALAIARGIEDKYPGAEILYIGTASGMEAKIIGKTGFKFKELNMSGLKRSLTPKNLIVLLRAGGGIMRARRAIKAFKPSAVIGTGGYVCGPVIMAAVSLRIPTLIHEQNALPGITNRVLSVFANRTMVTFEDSISRFPRYSKKIITGLPVRPEVITRDRKKARENLGIRPEELLILSFGGSQGAKSINEAMTGVLKEFKKEKLFKFIHVTGEKGYRDFFNFCKKIDFHLSETNNNIQVISYLHDMPEVLAAADLAVCRAGAATLSEMTVRGVPCILVPYPFAAENHQEYNARAMVENGASEMILDKDINAKLLGDKIKKLVLDKDLLEKMHQGSLSLGKPGALKEILNCLDRFII